VKAAEIRSKFLKYFEKNGHSVLPSSRLVPDNDPTLLFTNAGMVQFKDVFLGKDKRPYSRATTSQKCVRAGGKHNDLENVGFTARHHTFFEMLGNFSFGDYFKKEAIRFAWEFVTKELALPKDRLYVTVFEKDDEAAEIWEKQEGVPKNRIYRFGEKDNFWSMGDTGPCGPCSEIFIDRGEKYSCGKPTCAMGCDCDRYMEFWNLVFMQFDRDSSGKLTPLPKPSVDTGAGLERLASILQHADTNYDTDTFQHIISETAKLAHLPYDRGSDTAVSFRVIADHSRATAFLIGDGVMPSNEGRGYVLRRIMRRAIRHGKKLGFKAPFLHQTIGFVIDQMAEAYPDLVNQRAFIAKAVLAEEEQFFRTLERGLSLLDEETAKLSAKSGTRTLPGDVAFKLYDTFGFPLDLTRVICTEKNINVDEAGFERAMDKQRAESRKNWKGSGDQAVSGIYLELANELSSAGKMPKFVGYERTLSDGVCLAILSPVGNELKKVDFFTTPALAATADSAEKSPILEIVFSQTPFYGESGGQVGDRGRITGTTGSGGHFEGEVIDVQKPVPDLIVAHVRPIKGSIKVGSTYTQETDSELRILTAANHTATHMLQWALQKVLGKHIKQAGSLVTADLTRFDFTHFQAMSEEELKQVEDLVNERIWNSSQVSKKEMNKDEAISAGAIAFFGEKYGDRVRVVQVGDFSTELCGGTHVDNSGQIHLFKIGNESGIAAGVRRIIAYTSKGAFDYLRARDEEVKQIRDRLRASSTDEIIGRLDKSAQLERELRKKIEQLEARSASSAIDELLGQAKRLGETRVVVHLAAPDPDGVKKLRDLAEMFKQKAPDAVALLGMKDPDGQKASLIIAVGPKAPKNLNASEILKELAPMIDGRGGGKPDLAQAGGNKASALESALEAGVQFISKKLGMS
jgi:alanyl-tRNA synthetase